MKMRIFSLTTSIIYFIISEQEIVHFLNIALGASIEDISLLCEDLVVIRGLLRLKYNILTQGAAGVLCRPPEKGGRCHGYIHRFVFVCNYALCRYNPCCNIIFVQKIAPSAW